MYAYTLWILSVTQGGSKLTSIEGVQEEKVKQAVSTNNMVKVDYLLMGTQFSLSIET